MALSLLQSRLQEFHGDELEACRTLHHITDVSHSRGCVHQKVEVTFLLETSNDLADQTALHRIRFQG